jgi:hypothetical protein
MAVDFFSVTKASFFVKNFSIVQFNVMKSYKKHFHRFFNKKLFCKPIPLYLFVDPRLKAGVVLYAPDKNMFRYND